MLVGISNVATGNSLTNLSPVTTPKILAGESIRLKRALGKVTVITGTTYLAKN